MHHSERCQQRELKVHLYFLCQQTRVVADKLPDDVSLYAFAMLIRSRILLG